LLEGAQDLKLDVERVRRELANGTYRSRVRADFSTGIKSGVNGTPTFYINGVRHDGDFSADTLMAALGEALHSSGVKHA